MFPSAKLTPWPPSEYPDGSLRLKKQNYVFLKIWYRGFHIMKKWNSKSVGLCNNKILQLNETFLLQTTKNLQKVIIKHSKVISKGESFSDEPQSQMKWNLIWSLVVERTNLGFQFCFHDLSIATSAWIKICPVLITYLKIVKKLNVA